MKMPHYEVQLFNFKNTFAVKVTVVVLNANSRHLSDLEVSD
jgi:hypothetical protein